MRIAFFLVALAAFIGCTPSKNSPRTIVVTEMDAARDSVIYVETEIEARQNNSLDKLLGNWKITGMKRQARIDEEALTNTSLNFSSNGTFSGKGGCNNISGKFLLKGTGIKFSDIIATKMYCGNMEQEEVFLKFLTEKVTAYSVTKDSLLLRDGAANIIFRGARQ